MTSLERSHRAQVRALLIAVVFLVFALMVGYAALRGSGSGPTVAPTRDTGRGWVVGNAKTKAAAIATDGPILRPDPTGSQRLPLYLSHSGSSWRRGWYAFEARAPGAKAECFLRWDGAAERFEDPCSTRTYGSDGADLRRFSITVDRSGELIVDLSRPPTAGR
ncbi:MAG: hypothetical protein R2698_06390 [Microthrixaceae bacterium]